MGPLLNPSGVHLIETITPPPCGGMKTDGFITSTDSRLPQRGVPWRWCCGYSNDNGANVVEKPRLHITGTSTSTHADRLCFPQAQDGSILLACDAVSGGDGGTAIWLSEDDGESWYDPGAGQPIPEFADGKQGGMDRWHPRRCGRTHRRKVDWLTAEAIQSTDECRKVSPRTAVRRGITARVPFPVVSGGQRCVFATTSRGTDFSCFLHRGTEDPDTYADC